MMSVNQVTFGAMSQAGSALKAGMKALPVDAVEKTMGEIDDHFADLNDLSRVLSNPLGDVCDPDELMAELESELGADQDEEALLHIESQPTLALPQVPTGAVGGRGASTISADDDQRELDELLNWAS